MNPSPSAPGASPSLGSAVDQSLNFLVTQGILGVLVVLCLCAVYVLFKMLNKLHKDALETEKAHAATLQKMQEDHRKEILGMQETCKKELVEAASARHRDAQALTDRLTETARLTATIHANIENAMKATGAALGEQSDDLKAMLDELRTRRPRG